MKCVQTRLAIDALEQYAWVNLCRLLTPDKTRFKTDFFFYFKDENVTGSSEGTPARAAGAVSHGSRPPESDA